VADAEGNRQAVRLWARSELSRRARSLVLLGIIAGLAASVSMAAVAGARRTSTSYERFRRTTSAPDALVFGTQVGFDDIDYTPVAHLPEVLDSGTFTLSPIALKGFDQLGTLAPGDTHLYRTLARPSLVHGRLPDPGRADEVVINRAAERKLHLHVGSAVTIISANDINAFFGQAPMTGGPTVRARVVGVGDSMMDLIFGTNQPGFVPSGGFLGKYGAVVPHVGNLVVRLKPGTDVRQFHLRAASALALPDIPVRDLAEDQKRVTHGTDVEQTALLLFAAAALLAAIVLVGQAVSRTVYAIAESGEALRALGFTRFDLVLGMILPLLVAASVAVVAAVLGASALSSRFPVGLARSLDPRLGIHLDAVVLAAGGLGVFLLVIGGTIVAAYRATGRSHHQEIEGSSLTRRLRSAAPLPLAIGASLALEKGRGARSLPVRPALVGAVAGILGIVGALGVVHGIDDAVARPSRSGQLWDGTAWPDQDHTPAQVEASLIKSPLVSDVTRIDRVPLDVENAGLPVYALSPVRGRLAFVVLSGHAPRGASEAVVGPASLAGLHRKIGDRLRIGGGSGKSYTIVGTALLPQTPHSSFDQGVWITNHNLDRGAIQEGDEQYLVTLPHRGTIAAAANRLHESLGIEVDPTDQPQDVLLLNNVRTLPRVLAGFLVLLGIAALAHVLVTAVHRRRHDLAVLRALGFRPRQTASCIAWQATTVGLVGLVIGLPLGIATGRYAWRIVARATPLVYVAPIAAVAALVAIPATMAVVNALAALPARRAARLRPAQILRTE
jgi:hypothetical protein